MTRQSTLAYVATLIVFLALDAVWLGTMAERLYRPAIGHLMREGFAPAPAMAFYVLYILGLVVFAVMAGLDGGRATTAAWRGALFGLVAYATYDLTNQATLRDWPWAVTLADLAWGTFASALACAAGCRVAMALARKGRL
jgi:uncharacterized membrane protein